MFDPKTMSEQLLFTTIRMQIIRTDGETSFGTGFFFTLGSVDKPGSMYIITNKHVIADGVKGIFTLHEGQISNGKPNPTGNFYTIEIDEIQRHCLLHPNSEIDLCAISTKPLLDESKKIGKKPFSIPLDRSMILSDKDLEGLTAIEDVYLAGYPLGLWDEHNNLPIIRRGITASHPSMDFCGKSVTVIDAACFPGSSGSPVVILNEGMYTSKTGTVMGNRIILMGILYGGPVMSAKGEIEVREIPTARRPIAETEIPVHLGYTVKAREILSIGLT